MRQEEPPAVAKELGAVPDHPAVEPVQLVVVVHQDDRVLLAQLREHLCRLIFRTATGLISNIKEHIRTKGTKVLAKLNKLF